MNKKTIVVVDADLDYDLDGLKTDFPTATELTKFVFDETGISLNLKGRSNDIKYAVALDVLNGRGVDPKFITNDNPYVDRNDLIPEEPIKPAPARDVRLPDSATIASSFYTGMIPHPDKSKQAEGKKVDVVFRKYRNGMISYDVLGPLEPRPEGKRLNKYGKEVDEIIRWVDPRTGEQLMKDRDGSYSETGNRLRAITTKMGVFWRIDRDVIATSGDMLRDVWGTEEQ